MPATHGNLHTPPLHRIEYHIDRRKVALFGSVCVTAGILVAYPPATQRMLHSAEYAGAALIALSGAVALLTVGLYLLTRLMFWRGPAVVIDGHGIHDRRAGAIMTPWRCIRDIRVLDRYGHHIGIDTTGGEMARVRGTEPLASFTHPSSMTVIDTYFLRSATGDRVLDFVMPLTAMTPIDMSEIPVSEKTLAADAHFARTRTRALIGFILLTVIFPGLAALLLATT